MSIDAALNPPASTEMQNFEDFRKTVSASFVPLKVTSDAEDSFRAFVRSCQVADVQISEICADRHVVERTPELIAASDRHFYKISLIIAGTGILLQDDREAVLRPGELAVYDTNRPYSLSFDAGFRTMVVMVPRQLIDLPSQMVGQLTAVRMSRTAGIGKVIVPFLAQFADNLEQLKGPTGVRVVRSALDLVTTMLASELDLGRAAADPRQALMRDICDYIDRNLASGELGPTQIAAAHYISPRHLHGVFSEHGATVSAWIRTRRLERCRRDLIDPVYATRPVSAIAARWGFPDAAHFSRVFKAAFGMSPTEARAEGLTGLDQERGGLDRQSTESH